MTSLPLIIRSSHAQEPLISTGFRVGPAVVQHSRSSNCWRRPPLRSALRCAHRYANWNLIFSWRPSSNSHTPDCFGIVRPSATPAPRSQSQPSFRPSSISSSETPGCRMALVSISISVTADAARADQCAASRCANPAGTRASAPAIPAFFDPARHSLPFHVELESGMGYSRTALHRLVSSGPGAPSSLYLRPASFPTPAMPCHVAVSVRTTFLHRNITCRDHRSGRLRAMGRLARNSYTSS